MESRTRKRRGGWQHWTAEEAQRELTNFRRSGLPLETYARKRGFSSQRLRWWRERLGEREEAEPADGGVQLVPAVLTGLMPALASGAVVVVRMPGGMVLEISDASSVSPSWVAELAGALASRAG